MSATADEMGARASQAGRRTMDELNDGAQRAAGVAASELGNLLSDVEDLVKRVAHVTDADIARVRMRVQEKVASTREALTSSAESIRARASATAHATDDYVHGSPWQAVGIAAAVGALVGFLVSRR